MKKYVPILRCKRGEQLALKNLTDEIKDKIIPLIEIQSSDAIDKKPIEEIVESFWNERDFYFYYSPDWYEDIEDFSYLLKEKIIPLSRNNHAIPVIDLSLTENIDDWKELSKNGIAIRLRSQEFENIENVLNSLFKNGIERSQTDIIIDLQHVTPDQRYSKIATLKAVFSDLDKASEFRSIIIASVSFPRQFPQMDAYKIYRFDRAEFDIFKLSSKLAERFNFNYVYSDYGPTDIENIPFIVGMSPNFKIRYTTLKDYIFVKGESIKKGGLDLKNVAQAANIILNDNDFYGKDYSWGDDYIYQLATGKSAKPGNLTTWVAISMNHHMTFIIDQL